MKPHCTGNCYDFKINDPAGKQALSVKFSPVFHSRSQGSQNFPNCWDLPSVQGSKKVPGKKGKVQAMLGVLLHPEHGGVTPSPCPMEPRLQTDTQEVFGYIPHCSFVLCLLPGSRTATVSMVSARPIPVPGCETT